MDVAANRYILDDQVGYLLRLASQRHAAIFQSHMVHDLTPTQFSALQRLAQHGEVSQNQLGRLSAIDIATINGVVERLRGKDLIQSRPDPNDGRRVLLSLSPSGHDLIGRLSQIGADITRDTVSELNNQEHDTLIALLRKLS